MIKSIFVPSDGFSGLAHDPLHRVIGLILPPIDANYVFHHCAQLVWGFEEEDFVCSLDL